MSTNAEWHDKITAQLGGAENYGTLDSARI